MVLAAAVKRILAIVLGVAVIGLPLSMFAWFGAALFAEAIGIGPATAVIWTLVLAARALPLLFAAWLGNRMFVRGKAESFSAVLAGALAGTLLVWVVAIPINAWYGTRFVRSDADISGQYLFNLLAALPTGAVLGGFCGYWLLRRWRRTAEHQEGRPQS